MSDIEEQREYYERMIGKIGLQYQKRISDLQDENEKLRELVRDMLDELKLRDGYGFGYHSSFFEHRAKAL